MATSIEWTRGNDGRPGETWNPVTGCTKVSQGCKHCYAERLFPRPYPGRKFTDIRLHPERLDAPFNWRRPRRVFVNSLSDLFHEDVPDEFIRSVWRAMRYNTEHTFIILTKRPQRMADWLNRCGGNGDHGYITHNGSYPVGEIDGTGIILGDRDRWPLPNVWLGVSVEDQETADERIPLLLQTPAAVRFISAEPLLDAVSLARWLTPSCALHGHLAADGKCDVCAMRGIWEGIAPADTSASGVSLPRLDWVIAGGESGPKARPCDIDWIRGIVDQCAAADVPCFVKQLGAKPRLLRGCGDCELCRDGYACYAGETESLKLRDRKGGDASEWPEDLRVQEFPTC